MSEPEDRFVTIARYPHPPAAHLARMGLEAEGIEVEILDENTATVYAPQIAVSLLVRMLDVERAREIISAHDAAMREQQEITCRKCGSGDLEAVRFGRRRTAGAIIWIVALCVAAGVLGFFAPNDLPIFLVFAIICIIIVFFAFGPLKRLFQRRRRVREA